ncbi:ABC transporter permease subunit [Blastococcus sp. CT_GayMR20]|uniref:ABC transporter permease n=1 Tax=Blastococcus sp. CT_GayMR20 TaxID=2559609 RepID=UPI0010747B89|nr:ABC transporter permease subunit [Blastococcus sp. CT_GayMR20]TFV90231.1 ABC transporter permease subunit [Blastococcus sp. CT_GayMR20]
MVQTVDRSAAGPQSPPVAAPRRRYWPLPVPVARLLLILAWLVLWEITVRLELLNPILVATPSATAVEMVAILGDEEVRAAFGRTLSEYVVGFTIGAVAGIALGVVLGLSRPAFRVLNAPLMIVYGTPKSIFLPLFVVFLGLGFESPTAFAAMETVFPLVIAVVAGMHSLDARLMTAADAMGASRLDKVRFLIIPSALPSIISGMWLGLKQALLAVLLAELLISGGDNVGFYIAHYAAVFEPEKVYALIGWLSVFAITLGVIWRRVDAYAGRWRTAGRGASL